MPAALGRVIVSAARDLPGFRLMLRLRWAMACSIIRCGMWRCIGYVVLLTLSNGILTSGCIPPSRFTNVDDVTQDHANPRQYAPLLHRSSAAPHSTLPEPAHAVFLRRDLRQRADYFANLRSSQPATTCIGVRSHRRHNRSGDRQPKRWRCACRHPHPPLPACPPGVRPTPTRKAAMAAKGAKPADSPVVGRRPVVTPSFTASRCRAPARRCATRTVPAWSGDGRRPGHRR